MTRAAWPALVLAAGMAAAGAAAQLGDEPRAPLGERVYANHCAQCHGPEADGRGIHAERLNPRPSNLALSDRSDDYRVRIVTLGGLKMGRSQMMPEWGLELSAAEIRAVVAYLRKVSDQAVANRGRSHG